jgi:hypothetical protein
MEALLTFNGQIGGSQSASRRIKRSGLKNRLIRIERKNKKSEEGIGKGSNISFKP